MGGWGGSGVGQHQCLNIGWPSIQLGRDWAEITGKRIAMDQCFSDVYNTKCWFLYLYAMEEMDQD